jgi:hypothetical protein
VRILLSVLVFLPLSALAEVVTIDFVKVLDGNTAEAVYFYENNWKKFRIAAVKKGIISSYRLLVSASEKDQTDILLITVFASPEQYERREENFLTVMRDARESGPALLNDKPPSEFRKVVDSGTYTSAARPPEG